MAPARGALPRGMAGVEVDQSGEGDTVLRNAKDDLSTGESQAAANAAAKQSTGTGRPYRLDTVTDGIEENINFKMGFVRKNRIN